MVPLAKWFQSAPVPKTALPPLPVGAWNVGALPAPLLVSTWPDVPADELRTPVPLLSTTPALRGVNVIVPAETVSPFEAVSRLLTPSVPVIVLLPTIERPPAVVLIVLAAASVPATGAVPRGACGGLARPVVLPVGFPPVF